MTDDVMRMLDARQARRERDAADYESLDLDLCMLCQCAEIVRRAHPLPPVLAVDQEVAA